MEIPTLTVEPRKAAGSRAASRLRRSGKLPAVLYGHAQPVIPITLNQHDVEQQLTRGLHVVKLDMNGEIQASQFKDVQYDYLGTSLVHVDFVRVDLSERIRVTVPLVFRGTPKGVHEGGIFRHELTELEIECVVADIPESIPVDISDLALNQLLHIKDITFLKDMAATGDADTVVAMVRMPTLEAESTEAEAAEEGGEKKEEPEVIAKGKTEESSAD